MKYLRIIPILLFVIAFTLNLSAQTALELLIKAENSNDSKYCIELAKQAIAIAEKENDKGLIASANGQIAVCMINLGQLEDAEKLVNQITEMAETSGNPRALSYEWSVKGSIYYLKKDYVNAFSCFEKALSYSQKLNDSYYVREHLLSLVNCGLRAGKDPSVSIEYCNQALAYPDSKRGPNQKFNILAQLGNINYYYLDNSSKAIDNYNQADAATDLPDQKVFVAQQIAEVYQNMGNSNAAIEHLQKALKNLTGKISKTQEADLLIKLAVMYDVGLKDNAKAIEYYKQADLATDEPDQKAKIENFISLIYENMGNTNAAVEQLQNTIKNLNGKISKSMHSGLLTRIAEIYFSSHDYVKAIEYFKNAEEFAENPSDKANIFDFLGASYGNLGNGVAANEFLNKALKIYEELGDKTHIVKTYNQISTNYRISKQYNKSIDYAMITLPLIKELADKEIEGFNGKEQLSICYNNLVDANIALEKKEEAKKWLEPLLAIAKELKTPRAQMDAILSTQLIDLHSVDKSVLENLKAGYEIAKTSNEPDYIDQFQFYIGCYYSRTNNPSEAIPYFKEIIDRYEKGRINLPDELKLEYWSWLYAVYQNLIRNQIHSNDYVGTFNSIEKSTARLLLERIASKNGKSTISPIEIAAWQKNIASGQAVVSYGNLQEYRPTALVADATSVSGIEIKCNMWLASVKNRYNMPFTNNFEKLKALKRIESKQKESSGKLENFAKVEVDNDDIGTVISQYRFLLSKPLKTQQEKETIDFLGRRFYQLLILPIEDKLVGKTELLIIPNDEMAFLPFEAFIMPDGRYLVEKYDIRYLPSLSVGNELTNRKYSENRRPILAFGNAIYSSSSSGMDDRGFKNISSESPDANTPPKSEFIELMKGMGATSKEGKSMKRYYEALGIGWGNLSGTLAELDAISSLVPNAVCIKGKDVNEQNVKQMSANGQLKGYKILHFATHGIVIPEYQELSAIVLSQDQLNDDGYLRASEIAKLNLNADFVNLSACETGLGKIYGGEGVVGLTQSFLLAGANSIAVSLWKVSDQSTMEFQKEFYRLVFVEKMPISKAINQVKRTFIKGQYNQPFYWAPFVYYGM